MCFYFHLSASAQELKNRFHATFPEGEKLKPAYFNGFQNPETPVITNKETTTIQWFNWGLIPYWAKDKTIQKNTLNARIETIQEKVSFKSSINKRCIIPANGFWEWQWLDEKGRNKQKYEIKLIDKQLFAFAGLWSEWTDKATGEQINTYTILTTQANKLLSEIHNSKKRMPVILSKENETNWLLGAPPLLLNEELIAEKI